MVHLLSPAMLPEAHHTVFVTLLRTYTSLMQGGKIKTWKLRYCCLHGGQLFYFVDADAAKPKGSIPLAGLQCVTISLDLSPFYLDLAS